jgi:DNA-binding MarR family transcriptional regulator
MRSYHRLTCRLDRELETNHGISGSDFEVLQQLYASKDRSAKMNELAENVHLSQSALSRLVARLEKDGLIERCMCTEDRRAVFAQLTKAGAERYEAARPTQRAVLRDAATAGVS